MKISICGLLQKHLAVRFFSRGYRVDSYPKETHAHVRVRAHTNTHMCSCTSAIGDNHRSSSQQHPEGKKGEASKLSSVGKQEVHQEYLYNRIPSEKFQFIPEI